VQEKTVEALTRKKISYYHAAVPKRRKRIGELSSTRRDQLKERRSVDEILDQVS